MSDFGVGSAIGGIASGVGGLLQSGANTKAAQQVIQALQSGQGAIQQLYGQGIQGLQPFETAGQNALNSVVQQGSGAPGTLSAPFQPTMQQLEQTPGYQFALGQGLKATQNNLSAQGLGASGQAVAGAGNYATGLASQTYQNQFNNYLQQNQQRFNMLAYPVTTGLNAASQQAQLAGQEGQALGTLWTGIGNARGGGTLGAGNALAGAVNNFGYTPAATAYNGSTGSNWLMNMVGGLFGSGSGNAISPSTTPANIGPNSATNYAQYQSLYGSGINPQTGAGW